MTVRVKLVLDILSIGQSHLQESFIPCVRQKDAKAKVGVHICGRIDLDGTGRWQLRGIGDGADVGVHKRRILRIVSGVNYACSSTIGVQEGLKGLNGAVIPSQGRWENGEKESNKI